MATKIPVFQVAVRHANGKSNLFHVSSEFIQSHVQAFEVVRAEIPEARTILCAVQPGNWTQL